MSLAILDARVLTMGGKPGPRDARSLGDLGVLPRASVLVDGDRVAAVSPGDAGRAAALAANPSQVIEAGGRVLMPGFVDCHTHACWAGDRLDEWDLKRRGASYLDILNSGGGIMSTVRAVRAATTEHLAGQLRERLDLMLCAGSTTIEIKSGYGLTPDDEIKMLHAIRMAAAGFPGTIIPTALLGHALDPAECATPESTEIFVSRMVHTLDRVVDAFGPLTVDAFCEKGAWSLDHCHRLFEHARANGCAMRVHADQFNSLGMIPLAIQLGARSVDHLEASTDADLRRLAASGVFGVVLPVCGFHVDGRYARARAFLDSAPTAQLAIATNFNPGSAPSGDMAFAVALAVRNCGLTPAEAISASTINPAALLGFADRGFIAPGARADLLLLRHADERAVACEVGLPLPRLVIAGGKQVAVSARGHLSDPN